MVSSKVVQYAVAVGLGLVLLIVSCAPAAEPTVSPTTPPPTPTTAPPTPTPTTPPAPGGVTTATPTTAPLIATPRPPTPTPTPAAEQPRRGGTLFVGGTAPISFAAWEECCSSQTKMAGDSLLQYKPSNKLIGGDEEIEGRMAYEWSASKDGLSWTLKLEKGMTAALPDGTYEAVDCDDVAWALTTIKTGEGLRRTMRGRTFAPVTKIDCPDPLTAVIHTKFPYAALPGMLAVSINAILPRDYWKDRLKELPTRVVGSGPWKMERFIAGEIITYIPNPKYHRLAPDGKPYPYLARIEHRITDVAACGSALRTGRVHSCGEGGVGHTNGADVLYKEATHLQFFGPFRPDQNPEWGSKGVLGNNAMFFMAHHEKAPWNNVKIREALSLAVDRKTLCAVGIEGWCTAGNFIFWLGSPYNLPKAQVEIYPGYNINTVEQNVARARQILTSLGYKLYPDPAALKIDLPAWPFTGNYVQGPAVEMFRRAGFNPNMYVPEQQRVLSQVVSGEFDVVGWDQLVSQPDPNQICFEHYYTGSDRNYGRYVSQVADDLCEKMGQELDRTKRIELAQQYHKLILDDHARATFLWRGGSFAISPDLRGFETSGNTGGGSVGRMEAWWLAK